MAEPTTRSEFQESCLRRLGKPVVEINVDDDQVSDRIDESLRYFWDYHFDGASQGYCGGGRDGSTGSKEGAHHRFFVNKHHSNHGDHAQPDNRAC